MKKKTLPNKTLANRVRVLRAEAKLTQEQLGEKLNFTGKYIGDLENARRNITPQTAELMSKIFHCDANYLLDDSVKYKTNFDKYNDLLNKASYENNLILNTICALASLNDYDIEVKDIHNYDSKEDLFSKMNEYMIFKQNNKVEFTLSMSDVNRFGNILSDFFMSNIKWNFRKTPL